MGLHDSLLDVPERLRIWQAAGIRYFFIEAQEDTAPPPVEAAPASQPQSHSVTPAVAPPAEAAPPLSAPQRHARADAASPVSSPATAPSRSPAALPAMPADPAQWPEPWPTIFHKSPPHPRLVFTYAALGLDMTGRADARRGRLWRELIKSLGLAGTGAVGFWPHCLPDSAASDRDMAIFLAGLRLLQPAVLVFFGTPAEGVPTMLENAVPGCELVVLADAATLAGGDREAFSHAIARLAGR